MKSLVAIAEAGIRLILLGVIFGACVRVFMKYLNGSAMFCIDPPAADRGWEWKVPVAWFVIYGVSAFVASWLASIRAQSRILSVAIGVLAAVAIFLLRAHHFHGGLDQFVEQQEFPLGPLGLACGVVAGSLLHKNRGKNRRTKHCTLSAAADEA